MPESGDDSQRPKYFVGAVDSGKVILTQINNFQQLRPSFKHVDTEKEMRVIRAGLKQGFGQENKEEEK